MKTLDSSIAAICCDHKRRIFQYVKNFVCMQCQLFFSDFWQGFLHILKTFWAVQSVDVQLSASSAMVSSCYEANLTFWKRVQIFNRQPNFSSEAGVTNEILENELKSCLVLLLIDTRFSEKPLFSYKIYFSHGPTVNHLSWMGWINA